MLQQQVADASAASDQQKQSHQHTLALLDQAHLDQLLMQSRDHSDSETKLQAQVLEQTELTQQLQHGMRELEREHQSLKKRSAEEQAVVKMLLKQQAERTAETAVTAKDDSPTTDLKEDLDPELPPAAQDPLLAAAPTKDRTLLLEVEVLRREARVLQDSLAKAEAGVQELTQARRGDELASSSKLSKLERLLKDLEEKHSGSGALLEQTMAAMQSRTSLLLQQRKPGEFLLVTRSDQPILPKLLHPVHSFSFICGSRGVVICNSACLCMMHATRHSYDKE